MQNSLRRFLELLYEIVLFLFAPEAHEPIQAILVVGLIFHALLSRAAGAGGGNNHIRSNLKNIFDKCL